MGAKRVGDACGALEAAARAAEEPCLEGYFETISTELGTALARIEELRTAA